VFVVGVGGSAARRRRVVDSSVLAEGVNKRAAGTVVAALNGIVNKPAMEVDGMLGW